MEEQPIFGGLEVYRSRGAYLRRLEQYEKAKAAYDQAARFGPEDVRTLISRSQVFADILKPKEASSDANLALKLEPTNLNAKNMQARALYADTEFEKSMVTHYRGLESRKRPSYFRHGIDIGVETIHDCIGENAGNVMRDFLPLIKCDEALTLAADKYEPEKPKRISRISKMKEIKKFSQTEIKQKENLSRVLAHKYLGPMANDKFFLQALQKDTRLKSANSQGTKELKRVVDEALSSLTGRQDMLRAQRPYYTIKLAETAKSKHLNKHKQSLLVKEREIATRTAESYLRAIEKCFHEKLIKELLRKAERMQVFLDGKTISVMPDKEEYLNRLYMLIGEGILSMYHLSNNLSDPGNRRRVAFLMGMPVGRPSSYDSVIEKYPCKFDNIGRATDKVAHSLEICENLIMKCFLQFELSRLLCQQKNYAHSKYYARCCQQDAIQLQNNAVWWMNGLFAMISGDLQQGNTNDVCIEVDEGLEWAERLSNGLEIAEFLLKCKELVLETPLMDDSHMTMKRKKEILRVMDDKSRIDTEVLFRRMSTVSSRRKFPLLPRKHQALGRKMESDRQRYYQRGLSVIQGPERPLRRPPVSKVPGFQIFHY